MEIQNFTQFLPILMNIEGKLIKPTANFMKNMEQACCLGLMTYTQNPLRVGMFCLRGSQHLDQVFIMLTG